MSGTAYTQIDVWGLVFAMLMVCVAAGISMAMKLGVGRSLVWNSVRSIVQLLAMAIVIAYVIKLDNAWVTIGLICLMVLAATEITMNRAKGVPSGMAGIVLLSLAITMLLMLTLVAEVIIRPKNWAEPSLIIPLTGMLLGNAVSALALGLSRFFDSMRERADDVQTMLALGASPWEAARPSIRNSVKLGLLPSIAKLETSGIVTIPGMMSGQIISGENPFDAAKYQFVLLTAIAALTLVADAIILLLVYKRCFTSYDRYLVPPPAPALSFKTIGSMFRKATHQQLLEHGTDGASAKKQSK
ncbi:ABC transporter permease [Bifidobacterium gallicum]|uniref:ABC transporter ATP-binding protein n=1 Tax=Bifidobacterium gallicum DSM 20093 = LMG 11596 TaxID=561180 RepID=D1NV59_9BIFI|nr:ABC transporter permease [Bifidobacterium gallicum]EFA22710.1 TIGR00245 family protein [Bifidobacterium gallicum DSM 20093 = LMG 11596]KFI59661.1 ABC transporter ATP-binding protein [Bifidobacterium gallicum DSM 20093 = LMG 11596]